MKPFLFTISTMLLLSIFVSCSAFKDADNDYIKQTTSYPKNVTDHINYTKPVQFFYTKGDLTYIVYNGQFLVDASLSIIDHILTINFMSLPNENKNDSYTPQVFTLNLPDEVDTIDVKIDGLSTPVSIYN